MACKNKWYKIFTDIFVHGTKNLKKQQLDSKWTCSWQDFGCPKMMDSFFLV